MQIIHATQNKECQNLDSSFQFFMNVAQLKWPEIGPTVVVLSKALVGADIGGAEGVDLQADDAVAAVGASVLVANLDVLALELERHRWHGEPVQVPGEVGARVLDGVLRDLLLFQEVGPVGVSLIRLLVDIKTLRKPVMYHC